MTEVCRLDKGLFWATVRSNRQIGPTFFRLSLQFEDEGAKAFAQARPGQFMELSVETASLPLPRAIPQQFVDTSHKHILLRRPFSFTDIGTKGDKTFVDVLYEVAGPATVRMTSLSAGNLLSVIGPLGRGFWIPEGKKLAYLVTGGTGAPPLEHLAKVLNTEQPGLEAIVFAGARTAAQLPFERRLDQISQGLGFSIAEFARYGMRSFIATDDGSAGFAGLVTDCLAEQLAKHESPPEQTIIYACGPEPMLAKLVQIAQEQRIDCQVSMERMMACGIGVCQSCAVECKSKTAGQTVYKLCCQDGPVFDSREVVFGGGGL